MFSKLILFLISLFVLNCQKAISVSMATATSMQSGLVFDLFAGEKWSPDENAQFVKMHIYPDEPIQVSKIELVTCEKPFTESMEVFINFDETIKSLENNGNKATANFPAPVNARSITFNFEKNQNICLAELNIYNDKNKKVKLKGPRIAKGNVTASETGRPENSYSVMNLFDSRFEYAYASRANSKGVTLDFQFENSEKITSFKIWNGYQRSDVHCINNGRVQKLRLQGENYDEVVELKDEMGGQVVELPKPFSGKNLKLIVEEAYDGKKEKGIVISELRFFDGKEWFFLDPMPKIKSIAEENKMAFQAAGVIGILNRSLTGSDAVYSGDEKEGRDESNWTFRFRSDGSMFLEGNTLRADTEYNDEKGTSTTTNQQRKFFGLGNYEVRSKEGQKMELRVFGYLRDVKNVDSSTEEIHGDCNGCGRDCNKVYSPESGLQEKIFQEYLEIEPTEDGKYKIRNKKKTDHLDFDELDTNVSI